MSPRLPARSTRLLPGTETTATHEVVLAHREIVFRKALSGPFLALSGPFWPFLDVSNAIPDPQAGHHLIYQVLFFFFFSFLHDLVLSTSFPLLSAPSLSQLAVPTAHHRLYALVHSPAHQLPVLLICLFWSSARMHSCTSLLPFVSIFVFPETFLPSACYLIDRLLGLVYLIRCRQCHLVVSPY